MGYQSWVISKRANLIQRNQSQLIFDLKFILNLFTIIYNKLYNFFDFDIVHCIVFYRY